LVEDVDLWSKMWTAAFLGLAGSLSGRRVATDDQINIVIRTPKGLIGSRRLQLQ
jgi:hypothetical protein